MKRLVLATLAVAGLLSLLSIGESRAATLVSPCVADTTSPGVCPAVTATNPLPVSATITPSGTQDTNLKQVNGATVNVGAGAAGTGTQRVTTSTDSTIGTVTAVTTLSTVTNPVGIKGGDGSAINGAANATYVQPGTGAVFATSTAAVTSGGVTFLCSAQGKATAAACGTAAAHQAYVLDLGNESNTAISWLQVFDVAVGSVTVGTTVPSASIPMPPGGHVVVGIAAGLSFATQFSYAFTTTATGLTAPTSNCSINAFGK